MNTLNSKTNESNKFVYQFTDKLNLKNPNKNMALADLSIYFTWKNIKSEYNSNNFKISAPTWNDTFDLPDGSYSVSDIQDYFEYIIKKHETIADNPPVQIYVNKIKNRIVFRIKAGYKLELLTKETIQFLGSSKKDIDQNKFGQLITITPHSPTMLKAVNAEFSFIEIWFTDPNNRPLEIEDKVNITLIIGTN